MLYARKVRALNLTLPISPCYETSVDEDSLVRAMVANPLEEYSSTKKGNL